LKSQEATRTACVGLEQRTLSILLSVNAERLFACVHIVGKQFKQFYCRQLKMDNWIKCQPKCHVSV